MSGNDDVLDVPEFIRHINQVGAASYRARFDDLIARCREIIPCDTARISNPGNRMFLVIGFYRNTREDEGQWFKNGVAVDFDYVSEKTVASGEDEAELLESARRYHRLCEMSSEEFLEEILNG